MLQPETKECPPIPPDAVWETNTRRNAKLKTRNEKDNEKNSRNQPAYGRLWVWWPIRVRIWVRLQGTFKLNKSDLPSDDIKGAQRLTHRTNTTTNEQQRRIVLLFLCILFPLFVSENCVKTQFFWKVYLVLPTTLWLSWEYSKTMRLLQHPINSF